MTKQQIRTVYKEKRAALLLPDMHAMVAAMLQVFETIPLPEARYLLSYKAMQGKAEVPVHFFEEALTDRLAQLQVCYPSADFSNGHMSAIADNDAAVWELSRQGIEQPVTGHLIEPHEIDIVLVPLLAFDERGYRVGYGKGFYDRYLSRCRPATIKIGFSFFEALPLISDTDEYDVPLNYCVTPQQLYVF